MGPKKGVEQYHDIYFCYTRANKIRNDSLCQKVLFPHKKYYLEKHMRCFSTIT